jgi:hypothetical protein
VRARGIEGWVPADQLLAAKPEELERKARKVKRNKLVYSGLSA